MSFPPQGQVGGQPSDLENRLRGLILGNSTSVGGSGGPVQPTPQQPVVSQGSQVPPHLMRANPQDQQNYMRQRYMGSPNQPTDTTPNQQQQQGGRKRPNQAQRRQMNSQLSVPVEPRQATQAPPTSHGFSTATGFGATPRQYAPPAAQYHSRNYSQPNPPQLQSGHQLSGSQPPVGYQQRGHQQGYQHSGQLNQSQNFGRPRQQNGPQSPFGAPNIGPGTGNQIRSPAQQTFPHNGHASRPQQQTRQLYQPGGYGANNRATTSLSADQLANQSSFLEALIRQRVPVVGIEEAEVTEKDAFRAMVEQACREAIVEHEKNELCNESFDPASVELRCFGSMASGFATKASDMDLALLTPQSNPPDSHDSPIPRLLERKLLDMGFGARLLTRTRVPIIKLCQKPTSKLRKDLLEERLKWENGFTAAEEDIDGKEVEEIQKAPSSHQAAQASTSVPPSGTSPNGNISQLADLRQGLNDIGDYYGLAKKLLKDLGGQDIMNHDGSEDPVQVKILEDVCKAFLNGLSDDLLKSRLRDHSSLDFDAITNPVATRSLNGVYMQVEGERLAMAWDSRPLPESAEKWDNECFAHVTSWNALCTKSNLETSIYGRLLHQALEKLKKISSLQLVFLEQSTSEDPVQYHARVARLMSDLGGRDAVENDNQILAIFVSRYIAGIHSAKIRAMLQESISTTVPQTLKSIGLQHRALQLAEDYDKALASKTLFSESDVPYIRQYVSLLRTGSTDQYDESTPFSSNNLLHLSLTPQTQIHQPLLQKIATLPDPTPTSRRSRDRYSDHLEFPKTNIGIQCDVNFSAHLALHNTLLLKCYSLTDLRVKPLILFIKHWAKRRAINTPYRGTLSSYGYVLMVLHYLINVASPFVCPNLQQIHREAPSHLSPDEIAAQTTCLGQNVQFWRNEKEIASLSERGLLNHNHDSIGALARGFFEYYATTGYLSTGGGRGFEWGREVLSLRTPGGIITKQEKGWVGARTVTETTVEAAPAARVSPPLTPATPVSTNTSATAPELIVLIEKIDSTSVPQTPTTPSAPKKLARKEEVKEIRHRYLFAIEDPFEHDHNVARTVTHNGIVSIRDEFRRAWRIIRSVGAVRNEYSGGGKTAGVSAGTGVVPAKEEGLLDEVPPEKLRGLRDLMESIHGKFMGDDSSCEAGVQSPLVSAATLLAV